MESVVKRKPRVTYTIGLPGAGKTTWALSEQQRENSRGNHNVYLMSMDDLRKMANVKYSKDSEFAIRRVWMGTLRAYLSNQKDVIIHDTNLNPFWVDKIHDIAKEYDADLYFKDFRSVPLELCLERNNNRPASEKVPAGVIADLYTRYIAKSDAE